MTIDFVESFDHGDEFTTGWDSGGTGLPTHFGQIQTAGNVTWPAGRTGSCMHIAGNGSTAVSVLGSGMLPASTHRIYAFYYRSSANPSVASDFFAGYRAGFVNKVFAVRMNTNGTVQVECQGSTVNGPNITDGNWHRIDLHVDTTGTTYTIDWQVDHAAQTQLVDTGNTAGWTAPGYLYGTSVTTATLVFDIDDLLSSPDAGDYPINGGADYFIGSIKPNADGTHNAGTNVMEDQAGADIGAVTAFNLLDDFNPIDTANFVRQVAIGTGNYAEVLFTDVSETNILAASLLVIGGAATAVSPDAEVRLYDAADNLHLIFHDGEMVSGSNAVLSGMTTIPAPGGGWTKDFLNGLKLRVGYSPDASGSNIARFYEAMIQYAWTPQPPTTRKLRTVSTPIRW
jgi:hypothetical protein